MADLTLAPKYFRAAAVHQDELRVDQHGGINKAGVIRGLSVITRGEALGHDLWIDEVFLGQVEELVNRPNKGVKSRFAHPGLSSDGLGRHVGRALAAEVEGDKVSADLHFAPSAHETPDGDLAGYLMHLAEDDPEALGMSIVFKHDFEATEQFNREFEIDGEFQSPDPLNEKNLPHARLAEIRAVDFVDEPAANPDGLFHRSQEIPDEAFSVADYVLGRSDDKPAGTLLGLDADRVRHFVSRYLNSQQLQVTEMSKLAEETKPIEQTVPEAEQPVAEVQTEPAAEPAAASSRSEAARFREAFGDQGAIWYSEDKTFEECRTLELAKLREELTAKDEAIESLKQRLSAMDGQGESEPVDFDAPEQKQRKSFVRFRDSLN